MKMSFESGKFLLESKYEEKDAVKRAGFRWDGANRRWWTSAPEIANRLIACADDACRAAIEAATAGQAQAIEASRATTADIEIPVPDGLEYMPFQRAGINYALQRFGFDFSSPINYINGHRERKVQNADRKILQKPGIDGASERESIKGQNSAGSENRDNEIKEECGERGMAGNGIDSNKKGNASPGGAGKAFEGTSEIVCNQDKFQGRQRAGADRDNQAGGGEINSDGICPGICDKNEGTSDERKSSNELQGGFRESEFKSSNRTGRPMPSFDGTKEAGQEKRQDIDIIGMDGNQNKTQMKGGANPFHGGVLIADEMG